MTADVRETAAAIFDTPHNAAFRALGAIEPGQHWSAFDVRRSDAKQGKASRFVSTIWNYHSTMDERGRRTATEIAICQDERTGSLWYCGAKPTPGISRGTATAHWDGIQLAFDDGVPIIGVLKDAKSEKCALQNLFDIPEGRLQLDGSALWLRLVPRGAVGCAVRPIAIDQLTFTGREERVAPSAKEEFDNLVREATQWSAAQRQARLLDAPRFPKKVQVTSWAFSRNPDVVAEVLYRANGICQACKQRAPFSRRSDKTPYLEVHHRIQLSNGGEDTVENAIAVCPNCHREAHYG
jgi:hypothetical protein